MTRITEAFATAQKNVHLQRFGRGQWIVNVWSAEHRAWWQGNPAEWSRASAIYREDLIREALEAMNVPDAGNEAYFLAEKSGRWHDIVRNYVRGRRGGQ
jgi:LPS sulfotransferase NodH